jgi:hypothetical protein
MLLYRLCVSTYEGAAEMEFGVREVLPAISYAERVFGSCKVAVWRDVIRIALPPSLHLQADQLCIG